MIFSTSMIMNPAAGDLVFPTISNPAIIHEADTGVTTSGSDVTAWADQSGNGRNVSGPEGREPQLVTGVLNGHPVIRNSGTDYLVSGTVSGFTDATELSACFVIKCTNGASEYPNGVTFANSAFDLRKLTGSYSYQQVGTGQNSWTGGDDSNWHCIIVVFDSGGLLVWVDGSSQSLGGPGPEADIPSTNGFTYFKYHDADSNYWEGDIALVAMHLTAYDADDRSALHTYVSSKYGISI